MKVVLNVEPMAWAANNNGPWPEDDLRSLNTVVRRDVLETVRQAVSAIAIFEELEIEVEVK